MSQYQPGTDIDDEIEPDDTRPVNVRDNTSYLLLAASIVLLVVLLLAGLAIYKLMLVSQQIAIQNREPSTVISLATEVAPTIQTTSTATLADQGLSLEQFATATAMFEAEQNAVSQAEKDRQSALGSPDSDQTNVPTQTTELEGIEITPTLTLEVSFSLPTQTFTPTAANSTVTPTQALGEKPALATQTFAPTAAKSTVTPTQALGEKPALATQTFTPTAANSTGTPTQALGEKPALATQTFTPTTANSTGTPTQASVEKPALATQTFTPIAANSTITPSPALDEKPVLSTQTFTPTPADGLSTIDAALRPTGTELSPTPNQPLKSNATDTTIPTLELLTATPTVTMTITATSAVAAQVSGTDAPAQGVQPALPAKQRRVANKLPATGMAARLDLPILLGLALFLILAVLLIRMLRIALNR